MQSWKQMDTETLASMVNCQKHTIARKIKVLSKMKILSKKIKRPKKRHKKESMKRQMPTKQGQKISTEISIGSFSSGSSGNPKMSNLLGPQTTKLAKTGS
ncbi:hypothetical protein TorRG33x02_005540 [Trema orientale]|uniref:Uncharacterized protein n=1 Tax=Trema orientale TaxID=63057 RepID=A0A2P5G011_TREOI|nr:hypothetical protein TorRG33x02_005540 [Trema orientale]